MSSRYVAAIVGAVALLSVGCPEKPKQGPGGGAGESGGGAGKTPAPAAPEDAKYSKADPIDGVTIETEMSGETPDIPGGGKRTPAEEAAIKAMAEKAKFRMTLKITDERTLMTVVGDNMPMPEGSYIVYDGPGKRYAFVAAGKKEYRLLPSGQIASLFEGGPSTGRSNYTVTVTDTAEKKTISGFEAIKSDVEVGFDWTLKFAGKTKTGKTKAKLAVWHTADPKLKDSWAKQMIDFVTLPFQDDEGRKVADTLKAKLKFPLEWGMEVNKNEDGAESKANVSTTVTKVDVGKIPANTFQIPPPGMTATQEPWSPGKSKQLTSEDDIAKLREKEEPKKPDDGKPKQN
jgi:hypothetical protein